MRVVDVLVTTASAHSEVRAFRCDALGRRIEKLNQFRFGKLLLLAHDFRCDALALDGEWNEDRFPFLPRDTFATKGYVFDGELKHSSATISRARNWICSPPK